MGLFKSLTDYIPTISAVKTTIQSLKGEKKKAVVSATKGLIGGATLISAATPSVSAPIISAGLKTAVKSPLKTIGITGLGIAGGTALIKSPKLRKLTAKAPETFVKKSVGAGEIVAKAVEDPKNIPSPVEAFKKGGVKGGIVAGAVGGALAVAGGVAATKKIKEKLAGSSSLPQKDVFSTGIPAPSKPTITEPVSVPKEKKLIQEKKLPNINVKVNVKGTSKASISKRFINQENVIK